MTLTDVVTVPEAAEILAVSRRRVLAMIAAGLIPARQADSSGEGRAGLRRTWLMLRADVLTAGRGRRPPGRPKSHPAG